MAGRRRLDVRPEPAGARRRARLPRGRRARPGESARPRSTRRRGADPLGGAGVGTAPAARAAARQGPRARRAALASWPHALAGANDELDLLARRARGAAWHAQACLDADELDRVVWAEPERPRLGARGRVPAAARGALGRRPDRDSRLGDADDGRRLRLRARPARLARRARAGRRLAVRLRRAGAALPAARHARSRGRPAPSSASPRRWPSSASCPPAARSCSPARTGRSRRWPTGCAGGSAHELLVQGEAPRERLLERFRDEVDSVLVATGTFWQGVDIPGEALSLLVIDKLPFQPPDDPLVEARCERIAAEGGDWFADYALPSAVLQLRQGFGRLIRSRERPRRRLPPRPAGADARVRPGVPRLAAAVPRRRRPRGGARVPRRSVPSLAS